MAMHARASQRISTAPPLPAWAQPAAGNEADEGVPTGATDGREPAHGTAVEIAAGQRAAVTFAIEGDEETAAAAPRAAHAVKTSSAGETRALLDDERYCSKGACAAESPTAEGAAALSPRGAGSRAEMNATSSERDGERYDLKRAGDSTQPASGRRPRYGNPRCMPVPSRRRGCARTWRPHRRRQSR